eukprot:scaffold6161_cov158-Amphora_coffeaeformis.AAC.6
MMLLILCCCTPIVLLVALIRNQTETKTPPVSKGSAVRSVRDEDAGLSCSLASSTPVSHRGGKGHRKRHGGAEGAPAGGCRKKVRA